MITIPGYTILEQIGKGGMATVHLAIQESTQRKVAIKIMDTRLTTDPASNERFQKEARLSFLSHPNIITVYAGHAVIIITMIYCNEELTHYLFLRC